jgi:hypothetical protein
VYRITKRITADQGPTRYRTQTRSILTAAPTSSTLLRFFRVAERAGLTAAHGFR